MTFCFLFWFELEQGLLISCRVVGWGTAADLLLLFFGIQPVHWGLPFLSVRIISSTRYDMIHLCCIICSVWALALKGVEWRGLTLEKKPLIFFPLYLLQSHVGFAPKGSRTYKKQSIYSCQQVLARMCSNMLWFLDCGFAFAFVCKLPTEANSELPTIFLKIHMHWSMSYVA